MIGERTEDLGEVRINLAGELHLSEDIGKLRVAGDSMKLVNAVLLTLTDKWKRLSMCRVLRVSLPFLAI